MSESIQTLTLTDFLLARIAEDEASLKNATDYECWSGVDREYAECEAKRRILDEHPRCDSHDRADYQCDACQTCGDGSLWPCDTLRHLATVYADHPDYREEWRA